MLSAIVCCNHLSLFLMAVSSKIECCALLCALMLVCNFPHLIVISLEIAQKLYLHQILYSQVHL